ncbi:hypothetical protein IAU59_003959 [Kwoniella sp. CBS 9459]
MLTTRSALLALTSALYFGQTVLADTTFAGCFYNDGNFDETVDPYAAATPEACSDSCGTLPFYSYSATFTDINDQKECRCLTGYPSSSALGTGNPDTCILYDVRTISTTFDLVDCASSVTYNDDGQTSAVVGSVKECYAQCASQYIAVFWKSSTGDYRCQCGAYSIEDYEPIATCDADNYFIYSHPASAQASGLARRRARLERAHARSFTYCPSGLTACKVSPTGDEYECIDPNAELESCGGCLYGEVGNSSSVVGQDCSTMGAKLGASTCINGQCVASACQQGRTLVKGQCLSE